MTLPLSYARAVEDISRFQVPQNIAQAVEELQRLDLASRLLALYRIFFPDEWQASTAPWLPSHRSPHSPREVEFFQLASERLFPLAESWLDEPTPLIPFVPRDFDWWNCNLEEWEPAEQFLLSLYDRGFWGEEFLEQFGLAPCRILSAEQIDWRQLERLCQNVPPPLSYLYDTLSLIDHTTGSLFLDESWETGLCLEWSEEHLRLLSRHWATAEAIWLKEAELSQWLDRSPENKQAAIDLWNQASR